MRWIVLPYLLCRVAQTKSSRPMDRAEMLEMRESVREMLNHAFEGYMQYAYPRVGHVEYIKYNYILSL